MTASRYHPSLVDHVAGEGARVRGVHVRLLALLGMVVAALSFAALQRLFGVGLVGLLIGCLVAAVVVVIVDRHENGPFVGAVYVLFAVAIFVAMIVNQFKALGWGYALAIDVPVVLLVVLSTWYVSFGRQRIAAARLARRSAEALGWRYRKPDADLLRRARLTFPTIRNRVRTLYCAVEGTLDGVPLTLVSGRAVPQAWLVRLPFALPQVTAHVADGRASIGSSGGEPAYRRLLIAPAVVDAALAAGATEWRVERDDLVVVLRGAAGPDAVRRDAAQVARLVRALPLTDLHEYAIDPNTVPDPEQWTQRLRHRRHNQRMTAVVAAIVAVLLVVCGLSNVGTPSHTRGAVIMLWVSGGLGLLGALLWYAVPRVPAVPRRQARPTTRPSATSRDG
jgi:hypothetical protein